MSNTKLSGSLNYGEMDDLDIRFTSTPNRELIRLYQENARLSRKKYNGEVEIVYPLDVLKYKFKNNKAVIAVIQAIQVENEAYDVTSGWQSRKKISLIEHLEEILSHYESNMTPKINEAKSKKGLLN